ncbi:MAG TPA: double-strand break repair helicase AddA, partial [Caulobacteraceae bacterium]|nr:double-strand break repair helicase AddA [Caulobacteraceae bacterium]
MSARVIDFPTRAPAQASDPKATVFVAANAGSGKTYTLVQRVVRLLLAGAMPEAILCVTYTKAGAAEMQRRLFRQLGDWAVMADEPLRAALANLDEAGRDLSAARTLFARALETPGGLKIQTIHAFCEKLLRRFPLEAGVSPGFTVLEDAAAAELSARARKSVALYVMDKADGAAAEAYAHFSVELAWPNFNAMFQAFEDRRRSIEAYVGRCGGLAGASRDVWKRCGFERPRDPDDLRQEALDRLRWGQWRRTADALAASGKASDAETAAQIRALEAEPTFPALCRILLTDKLEPRQRVATAAADPQARSFLEDEQRRLVEIVAEIRAATVARDTVLALILADAYAKAYDIEKTAQGALDFDDLVARTEQLLTARADAAWVLYKLDGGLEHVLLDEAQDTAPEQWDILRALTAEFFVGVGASPVRRTVFAVGDEKQSIFSFQGAAPERMAVETRAFEEMALAAGAPFARTSLLESRRSAPEILEFVDGLFEDPAALAGLRPAEPGVILHAPVRHKAFRDPGGCVELWPLEETEPAAETDPWEAVDAEPAESGNRKLARRIARSIKAMVARGDGVHDRTADRWRPCVWGDVLILVRRRGALFHEVIRALKREGVPVGGADRLKLSDHAVFKDLMALARFVRFPPDDLTLAALLRSPFCDVSEESLYDLAFDRGGSLWATLNQRADERPEWRQARDLLAWAIDEARARPPFDFYGRVLSRLGADGRSMRERILTRMGSEAQDALDAFLAETLASEGRDVRDLERFVAAMAATEIEVKREQEDAEAKAGGGEVRVMTVHGAKGLEAPIVILPDTTTRALPQGGPLLDTADGGFLWAPRKADDCKASADARSLRDFATDHESLRL